MSWKDGFNAALLKFLKEELKRDDAVEVIDFETERQERGYFDTCGYNITVVVINYRDSKGFLKTAEWDGDFGELIRELTEE